MLHSTIRQAALGLLLMCSVPCHFSAQTSAVQQGMIAVCTFHNVTEEEVLDSPHLQSEVCLVGPAFRVLKRPEKDVPTWQLLEGESTRSLEERVLSSGIRPVPGSFTWLKSIEGWFVVIPSQERFEVLLNRMEIPRR